MSIEKSIRRLGIVSVASIAPALWVVGRAQVSSLFPSKLPASHVQSASSRHIPSELIVVQHEQATCYTDFT